SYAGELGSNISAALATRMRSLSLGAAGEVLSGTDGWSDTRQRLVEQNTVIELESIGDAASRSLVMSLFVLYYRYGLKHANALTNLLVLEEAHRIIGKQEGRGK